MASETSTKLADRVQSLRLPPTSKRPSNGAGLPWALCLLSMVVIAYLLYAGSPLQRGESQSDVVATSKPGSKGTGTTPAESNAPSAAPAVTGDIALESKGYIIPEQQILVSPQVSGRIIELNFDAGQRVEKDFVLAILDNTEYLAEFDRIQATLESSKQNLAEVEEGNRPDEKAQSKAELAEAETNLAQSEREFQRKKDLMERKIVSKEDFEAAESQYRALAKRVERLAASSRLMNEGARTERKRSAKAQTQQIEAELRRAKWRLDNCVITAPISGTILKKNAELGNLVNPIAFNGSYSLCDIADLSKLEVDLSIQERDISRVYKGQKCRVRAEAFPKRAYEGVVSRLMPIADRAKGALPVRVRLTVPAEEEGMYLKPEMGAIVTFYNSDSPKAGQENEPRHTLDPMPSSSSASSATETAKPVADN